MPEEEAIAPSPRYRLILFVAGDEKNSRIARSNLDRICREDLEGNCQVQIVDVLKDFALATAHNILLTPSLLVIEPEAETLIIGNLKEREKIRSVLGAAAERNSI